MLSINANSFDDVSGARSHASYMVRSPHGKGGGKIQSPMIAGKCVAAGIVQALTALYAGYDQNS